MFYLAKVDNPDEDKSLTANLRKRIADLTPPRKIGHPIKFVRLSAPPGGATAAEIYAMAKWGVAYVDRATSTQKIWPFFETKDGKLRRKELKNEKDELDPQLLDAPFSVFTSGGTDIEVNLPTVDFGAHRTFLSSNGAF